MRSRPSVASPAFIHLSFFFCFHAEHAQTVGFIGLGNMGGPMARNLQAAGHKMVVFDLSVDATAKLAAGGASVAKSPREVASKADVSTFCCLPASQAGQTARPC